MLTRLAPKRRASLFKHSRKSRATHCLLHAHQHLAFRPEFLKQVVIALGFAEDMKDNIAKIGQHPAIHGVALHARVAFVGFLNRFGGAFKQRIQHALAGAGADDEIVCEGGDTAEVQQEDIFRFFVFERIYKRARQFYRFQNSPLVCLPGRAIGLIIAYAPSAGTAEGGAMQKGVNRAAGPQFR